MSSLHSIILLLASTVWLFLLIELQGTILYATEAQKASWKQIFLRWRRFETGTTARHSTKQHAGFFVLDPLDYQQYLGSHYDWAVSEVPFVDFSYFPKQTGERETLTKTFYYRWKLLQKHLAPTEDGWIMTEFLPKVPWSGKHNTIPAAAGHHIREGRWLHRNVYVDDYIRFWADFPMTGANPFSYTNWIIHSAYERYLLNADSEFIQSVRDGLARMWEQAHDLHWREFVDKDNATQSCYYQTDGADAMEVSISGDGCRPTMASCMFGDAQTLSYMGALNNNKNETMTRVFQERADTAKDVVLNLHWNADIDSFAVVPISSGNKQGHGKAKASKMTDDCDLSSVRIPNQTVAVRELLAFTPFYFASLAKALVDDNYTYLRMFDQLQDPDGFAAKYGLRTAERRSHCYNYSYEHGDCWNGPSWPYETSRVLTGLSNVITHLPYDNRGNLSLHFYRLLVNYARQHTDTFAVNDTAVPLGSGHVFENVHPDDGYWIDRQLLYSKNDTLKDMGNDYFHSTFNDIVLSGLFGIRPFEGGISVLPNVPSEVQAWAVDHLLIRQQHCAVVWDQDGSHYGLGAGVNGRVVVSTLRQQDGLTVGNHVLPLS